MPQSSEVVRERGVLLRMLILGPSKSGKSCSVLSTAPGPIYLINFDPDGSFDNAVYELGAEFEFDTIRTWPDMLKVMQHLKANPKKYKTIVYDTLTSAGQIMMKGVENDPRFQGENNKFAVFAEVKRRLMEPIDFLFGLPDTHVILIGHASEGRGALAGGEGHVPLIPGQAKNIIPAMCQDVVWLELTLDEKGKAKRDFLTAPQGAWKKTARSTLNVASVPADITKFIEFAEAGRPAAMTKKLAPTKPEAAKAVAPKTNGAPAAAPQPPRKMFRPTK